jgi:hypothetical protein
MSRELLKHAPNLTAAVTAAIFVLSLLYNISFYLGLTNGDWLLAKKLLSILSMADQVQITVNLAAAITFLLPFMILAVYLFTKIQLLEIAAYPALNDEFREYKEKKERKHREVIWGKKLADNHYRNRADSRREPYFVTGFALLGLISLVPITYFLYSKFIFFLSLAFVWLSLVTIVAASSKKSFVDIDRLQWAICLIPTMFIIVGTFGYFEGNAIRIGKDKTYINDTQCAFVSSVRDNFLCYEHKTSSLMLCSSELVCRRFLKLLDYRTSIELFEKDTKAV